MIMTKLVAILVTRSDKLARKNLGKSKWCLQFFNRNYYARNYLQITRTRLIVTALNKSGR